jgi:hypothetical protein
MAQEALPHVLVDASALQVVREGTASSMERDGFLFHLRGQSASLQIRAELLGPRTHEATSLTGEDRIGRLGWVSQDVCAGGVPLTKRYHCSRVERL